MSAALSDTSLIGYVSISEFPFGRYNRRNEVSPAPEPTKDSKIWGAKLVDPVRVLDEGFWSEVVDRLVDHQTSEDVSKLLRWCLNPLKHAI